MADWDRLLRHAVRVLALSGVLGLASGYSAFYAVFPNMTFPAASEASLGYVLLLLVLAALPCGFLAARLQDVVVQAFVAVPLGMVVASLLAVSPILTGLVEGQADVIAYEVTRSGFFVFILALILDSVGGAFGLMFRERSLARAYSVVGRIR